MEFRIIRKGSGKIVVQKKVFGGYSHFMVWKEVGTVKTVVAARHLLVTTINETLGETLSEEITAVSITDKS